MAAVALHTHVAETDDEARERAARAFDLYVDTRLYARKQVYDDIIASGLSLFGSPAPWPTSWRGWPTWAWTTS